MPAASNTISRLFLTKRGSIKTGNGLLFRSETLVFLMPFISLVQESPRQTSLVIIADLSFISTCSAILLFAEWIMYNWTISEMTE